MEYPYGAGINKPKQRAKCSFCLEFFAPSLDHLMPIKAARFQGRPVACRACWDSMPAAQQTEIAEGIPRRTGGTSGEIAASS